MPNILSSAQFPGVNGQNITLGDSNWTIRAGTFQTLNGNARSAAAGNNYAYHSYVPTSDYSVKTGHIYLTNNGSYTGPAVRGATGADSFYHLRLNVGTSVTDTLELFSFTTGTATLIASASTGLDIANNTSFTLTLTAVGNELFGYYNDTLLISITDSTHSTGRGGIRGNNNSGTTSGTHIDDWYLLEYANLASGNIQDPPTQLSGNAQQPLTEPIIANGSLTDALSELNASASGIAISNGSLITVSLITGTATGIINSTSVLTLGANQLTATSGTVIKTSGVLVEPSLSTIFGTLKLSQKSSGELQDSGVSLEGEAEQITVIYIPRAPDVTGVVMPEYETFEVDLEEYQFHIPYEISSFVITKLRLIPDTIEKSAGSNLLYEFDWTAILGSVNINSTTITTPLVQLAPPTIGLAKVQVWLQLPPTIGVEYTVKCEINYTPNVALLEGQQGKNSRTLIVKAV